MFGRWVLFGLYFLVATFIALVFAFGVVNILSTWSCHNSAQDLQEDMWCRGNASRRAVDVDILGTGDELLR